MRFENTAPEPPEGGTTNAAASARKVGLWLGLISGVVGLLLLFAIVAVRFVPLPESLFAPVPAQLELTDRHGTPLRRVRPPQHAFARPVTLAEIPTALTQATVSAEDKRFWQHPGVDWRAYGRAVWLIVRHGRVVSGGSTITQQLIKIAQPRPRTFRTKFIEALQALRLEQVWDKQRILAEYLNRLDYGNLNTGCAAASEFYFGVPPMELSIAQCALLAGLPQAPTRLNPVHHLDRAQRRQHWVLHQMRANCYLSDAELTRALEEQIVVRAVSRAFQAPHFVELLLASLPARDETQPAVTGIRTTLDLALNRFVEETIRRQIGRLATRQVNHAAAVVIDNATGHVLALVGSKHYFDQADGQVNGAWAPRSAGSTLKPFTYLLAWETGANPATLVADLPVDFPTATGVFSPLNYDRRFYGPMRHRQALGNSLNISAVKVLDSIGGPSVLRERLRACGLTTITAPAEHYGLGLTIGNADVRLLELANAYACLARLGQYQPYLLDKRGAAPGRRVADPGACFLLADVLSDNSARARAFGPDSSLRFDFPVACKTGTSSDFKDNWAFGYTPEFTVGVWVGNFDGKPMAGVSGVTGAAPIMHELFEHLHARFGLSWYKAPPEIVQAIVHPITGKRLRSAAGVAGAVEFFRRDRLPGYESPEDYDARGRIRLPAEYRAWLATSDNWLGTEVTVAAMAASPRIDFPVPGTVFYLDADLPDEGRRVPLKGSGNDELTWRSETLTCGTDPSGSYALLETGRHRLQLFDLRTGTKAETWIEVMRR